MADIEYHFLIHIMIYGINPPSYLTSLAQFEIQI